MNHVHIAWLFWQVKLKFYHGKFVLIRRELSHAVSLQIFCHYQKVENQVRAMIQIQHLLCDEKNFPGFHDSNDKST